MAFSQVCGDREHGATCAIDIMSVAYYYGMYRVDGRLHNSDNVLLNKLTNICRSRKPSTTPTYYDREDVWSYCVENLPDTYAPKGNLNADILLGFQELGKNTG